MFFIQCYVLYSDLKHKPKLKRNKLSNNIFERWQIAEARSKTINND